MLLLLPLLLYTMYSQAMHNSFVFIFLLLLLSELHSVSICSFGACLIWLQVKMNITSIERREHKVQVDYLHVFTCLFKKTHTHPNHLHVFPAQEYTLCVMNCGEPLTKIIWKQCGINQNHAKWIPLECAEWLIENHTEEEYSVNIAQVEHWKSGFGVFIKLNTLRCLLYLTKWIYGSEQ